MSISIATSLVPGSIKKQFRNNGRPHYNVRLALKTDDASELSQIDAVQYELHPTFKQRTRISENSSTNFEIQIWTWGYFAVKAKLYLKSGGTKVIDGYVKW